MEIHASKPIVPFRETAVKGVGKDSFWLRWIGVILMQSLIDMAPPKFGGTKRGQVVASGAHGLLKFTIRAAPLPKKLWDFLQANLAILRRLQQERKSREEGASEKEVAADEEGDDDQADEVDLQGEVIRRPTVRPDEFWTVLQQRCAEAGGEWAGVVERLWAFGPQQAGTCILVDARGDGQPPNS